LRTARLPSATGEVTRRLADVWAERELKIARGREQLPASARELLDNLSRPLPDR
jgi:hypothetical protein